MHLINGIFMLRYIICKQTQLAGIILGSITTCDHSIVLLCFQIVIIFLITTIIFLNNLKMFKMVNCSIISITISKNIITLKYKYVTNRCKTDGFNYSNLIIFSTKKLIYIIVGIAKTIIYDQLKYFINNNYRNHVRDKFY